MNEYQFCVSKALPIYPTVENNTNVFKVHSLYKTLAKNEQKIYTKCCATHKIQSTCSVSNTFSKTTVKPRTQSSDKHSPSNRSQSTKQSTNQAVNSLRAHNHRAVPSHWATCLGFQTQIDFDSVEELHQGHLQSHRERNNCQ